MTMKVQRQKKWMYSVRVLLSPERRKGGRRESRGFGWGFHSGRSKLRPYIVGVGWELHWVWVLRGRETHDKLECKESRFECGAIFSSRSYRTCHSVF
jgi:hypothetical protein